MSDNENVTETEAAPETDVTKEWRATQEQKSKATRLRLFAAIAWLIAIGGEVAGIEPRQQLMLVRRRPRPNRRQVP